MTRISISGVMRLATGEFIRRFLIHVLPDGCHRIRRCGLPASAARKTNIAKIRNLPGAARPKPSAQAVVEVIQLTLRPPCSGCGGATGAHVRRAAYARHIDL